MANVTPLKFHNNPLKLDLLPDKVVRVEFRGAVPSGPWPNGITTPPVNEATIEILVTFNNGDTKPFHLDNPVPVVPGETLVVRGPFGDSPASIRVEGTQGNEVAIFSELIR